VVDPRLSIPSSVNLQRWATYNNGGLDQRVHVHQPMYGRVQLAIMHGVLIDRHV